VAEETDDQPINIMVVVVIQVVLIQIIVQPATRQLTSQL
jgi:hypothetical protein